MAGCKSLTLSDLSLTLWRRSVFFHCAAFFVPSHGFPHVGLPSGATRLVNVCRPKLRALILNMTVAARVMDYQIGRVRHDLRRIGRRLH